MARVEHAAKPQTPEISNVYKAAAYGDFERLRAFLEERPEDVHNKDEQGYYALQWAALNNRVDITTYLIEVAHIAAQYGQTNVLYHLVRKWGADVDVADNEGDMLGTFIFSILNGSLLLSVSVLTFIQGNQITRNITTNEMANSHRYKYLQGPRGQFHNPFDEGSCNNFYKIMSGSDLKQKEPLVLTESMKKPAEMEMHCRSCRED
eukprot:jgi/Pico_ML_1/50771/g1920.t1